jgi:hypothetical protein
MNLHMKINILSSNKYNKSCSDKIYNFYIKNLENKVIEKKRIYKFKVSRTSKLGYKVTYRTKKRNRKDNQEKSP